MGNHEMDAGSALIGAGYRLGILMLRRKYPTEPILRDGFKLSRIPMEFPSFSLLSCFPV